MFYRSTKVVLGGILLTGGILLSGMVWSGSTPAQPHASTFGSIAHPTNSVGLLNQCGEVFTFSMPEEFFGVLPEDFVRDPRGLPIPPMHVPAYGFMSPEPFDLEKGLNAEYGDKEVYSYPEMIRGLWEGVKVIWVGDEISEEAFDVIQEFALEQEEPTIVLNWNLEKPIPRDRPIAFSAWGVTQTCVTFDVSVFQNFVPFTEDPAFDRDRENPPVAPVDEEGKLFAWFEEE